MSQSAQDRTVVVTGLGATTPLGGDVASTWAGLLAGSSGVQALTEEWAAELPARIAAPVAVDPSAVLDRVEARTLDRSQQLALIAAREAWADAGSPAVDPERLAVVVASGIGGVSTLLSAYDTLNEKGARRVSPHTVPMLMPNGPAATVGLALGARAGVHTPVSACASGAEAISLALDLIRAGRADVVVAGGTEACIHALPMAGFAAMRALSTRNDEPTRASRPYDKGRDGFVLAGSGITSDAHHIAAPDPAGTGAARAMTLALRDAGLTPADVVHLNAHATSTPAGDVAEALAIRTVFGDHAGAVAVTATKSMTGHLLGAAGAVEAIAAVLATKHRTSPATANLDDPDDEVGLDVVRLEPRALGVGAALSNSFGFGGHNVALVVTPA